MSKLTIGSKEYFKGIGEIKFEGKESKNPLAHFRLTIMEVIQRKGIRVRI